MPFALVDCENFYASCERLFEPRLHGRPVVVLSNNDGCIIARSEEAKALGVPMGAPLFEWRRALERAGAVVRSANFGLYGDLSRRVMETLRTLEADVEVYSIDEAFLALPAAPEEELAALAEAVVERVGRWTGVPVRVGIAATKTLAKVASEAARRERRAWRVLAREADVEAALAALPVEDVWGIGRKLGPRLRAGGVATALDLRDLPAAQARALHNVTTLRTIYELQGVSCIPLERAPAPRRSLTYSRSFGRPLRRHADVREAVAAFAARAAEKARGLGLAAGALRTFVVTEGRRGDACTVRVTAPTNATPPLIAAAAQALGRVWRDGPRYVKAGVLLLDLSPAPQRDLFAATDLQPGLHRTLDAVNGRFGRGTLVFASTGVRPRGAAAPLWPGRHARRSPLYTTRWADLPRVRA